MAWLWFMAFVIMGGLYLINEEGVRMSKGEGKAVTMGVFLFIIIPLFTLVIVSHVILDSKMHKIDERIIDPNNGLAVRLARVEERLKNQILASVRSEIEKSAKTVSDQMFVKDNEMWKLLRNNTSRFIKDYGDHPLVRPHLEELRTVESMSQTREQFKYAMMPPK